MPRLRLALPPLAAIPPAAPLRAIVPAPRAGSALSGTVVLP